MLRHRLDIHFQVRDLGRALDRSDEFCQVPAQLVGVAPIASPQDTPLGIEKVLGVRAVPDGMLQVILHGVGNPGDLRPQGALGFLDVHQALLEGHRVDVAVQFGMCQRLVEVNKPDTLRRVIAIDRLQPGDVTNEGRSSQTSVDENRILPR